MVNSYNTFVTGVRVASRSISPPWGSIRFRLAPRTHWGPTWGCIVRAVPDRQTKSRKIPTRKILPLVVVIRHCPPSRSYHRPSGTRREPFNFAPMGVNSISARTEGPHEA